MVFVVLIVLIGIGVACWLIFHLFLGALLAANGFNGRKQRQQRREVIASARATALKLGADPGRWDAMSMGDQTAWLTNRAEELEAAKLAKESG